jgi:hypothetical protein
MLHFGIRLLGIEKTLDQIGFAGPQVPLTRPATIAIGACADPVVGGCVQAKLC